MTQYLSLAFFLLAVVAASALGAGFETGEWYEQLNKSSLTPPNWVFGPVWAVIYLLMAVAAWRVWLSGKSMRMGALAWWVIVLVLQVSWSWLMFGLNRPGWALGMCGILLGLSIMCLRSFSLVSRPAGTMLLPLVIWLAFATYLNYSIWALNGGGLGGILG